MPELGCDVTPDGTYIFEMERPDGARVVVTVFPEDIDEIAAPRRSSGASASPGCSPTTSSRRRRRAPRPSAAAPPAHSTTLSGTRIQSATYTSAPGNAAERIEPIT